VWIFIWRRKGWLTPFAWILPLIFMQLLFNVTFGEHYYFDNWWPKAIAVMASATSLAALGYFLNYKKREILINNETGDVTKSPSHTMFFIPIEYWAVISIAVFIFISVN